jgi:hypothetical protein
VNGIDSLRYDRHRIEVSLPKTRAGQWTSLGQSHNDLVLMDGDCQVVSSPEIRASPIDTSTLAEGVDTEDTRNELETGVVKVSMTQSDSSWCFCPMASCCITDNKMVGMSSTCH